MCLKCVWLKDTGSCVRLGMCGSGLTYLAFASAVGFFFKGAVDGSCNVNWAAFRCDFRESQE